VRRLLAIFALITWAAGSALAGEPAARVVTVEGEAVALRAGQVLPLAPGAEIHARDHLSTAPGAKLKARFDDGTTVVLAGASAAAVDIRHGDTLALRLTDGAILVEAGRVGDLRLRIPVAVVGVRGTRFWAGPVDGRFGVLLLDGGIWVENRSGRVELDIGGTGVFLPPPEGPVPPELAEEAGAWAGPGAPPLPGGPASPPMAWPTDLTTRVLSGVTIGSE
jgi:ferric-dicitrate binding protein FerR (iron transport regulator)